MTFNINIDSNSNTLKYLQLVDTIIDAMNDGTLNEGDMLPSINELIKSASLSRDTIFKAYNELKNRGIVESVPNKGYFICRQTNKVLLFLDTFKAYKEVLYDGFRSNLPDNIMVDLMFHHYNIDVLETILNDSIGKYSHYIIMNFNHSRMADIISKVPKEKLLIIDWNINTPQEQSYVIQDFGNSVYNNFKLHIDQIKQYERFVFLYPKKWTFHPQTTIDNFERFCSDFNINHHIAYSYEELQIQKGDLYLLVSDRTLTRILDYAEAHQLQNGTDIGIISYNETPMKKYIKDGITVLSTDFYEMGKKAAEFVLNPGEMQEVIPTQMIIRNSFK